MAKKEYRILAAPPKFTLLEKETINLGFRDIIADFKKQFIKDNPNKNQNYLVDIYPSWYRHYFYLCEKFKSEFPNRIADEFETKFVRLEFAGKDRCNISYFRHTGQWWVVGEYLTLEECKKMIVTNPIFHPLG